MSITGEQILETFIRRDECLNVMQDVSNFIYGVSEPINRVIAPDGVYSEWATVQFVDDVVSAYTLAQHVKEGVEYEVFDASSHGSDLEREDEAALLSPEQKRFLRSMLYCMTRLVADSPWFEGTFKELEEKCAVLLNSFAHEVPREEIWRADADSYIRQGGKPFPAAELGGAPGTMMSSMFPIIGSEGYLSWSSEFPAFFLEDLNRIYEALSGKHIAESIPRRSLDRLLKGCRPMASSGGDPAHDDEAALADETASDKVKEQDPFFDPDDAKFYAELKAQEAAENEAWVRDFPRKEQWCKCYLTMRRSYFKLGGIGPLDEEKERLPFAEPINSQWLEQAIDVVIDARHIAHFTDEYFQVIYERLKRLLIFGARAVEQRR